MSAKLVNERAELSRWAWLVGAAEVQTVRRLATVWATCQSISRR